MRDGRNINSLIILIEIAIDLDDKLYKRKIKRNPKSGKKY